jgi:hypothetical protein
MLLRRFDHSAIYAVKFDPGEVELLERYTAQNIVSAR